ncbi:MAG: hypothetical protein MUC65_03545 [Pontiellaceae bacterium]|jgi:hypothetical protein|nr:hypothetical protein [Pontiellaceae bacterium]
MIELEVIDKMGSAQRLISRGKLAEAVAIIDAVVSWYSEHSHAMSEIEKMELLGGTADLYCRADKAEKEIPLWEELCRVAESELSRLGLMASDEDVLRTGFDFIRLGRAYRKQGRTFKARGEFGRAAEFLAELKIDLDIDRLLSSDDQVLVGMHNGQKMVVN